MLLSRKATTEEQSSLAATTKHALPFLFPDAHRMNLRNHNQKNSTVTATEDEIMDASIAVVDNEEEDEVTKPPKKKFVRMP